MTEIEERTEGVLYEFDATDFAGCATGPWLGWWKASGGPGGGLWYGCFGSGMWSPQYFAAWRAVDVPSLLAAYRERDEMRADRNEWRNAAYAAKGHYEQSDDRLARVEAVCRDAESMQWADVSRAYGEGVSAAISWVRAALGSTEPKDGTE